MESQFKNYFRLGNLAVVLEHFFFGHSPRNLNVFQDRIKDRKVHMADKRYEWINEFRENVWLSILKVSL